MATPAAILDSCETPLVTSLIEELVSVWRVTVEEATAIRAIVNAWGDEPAHGRGQAELRAEIAGRVTDYLRRKRLPAIAEVVCGADEPQWECGGCSLMHTGPVYATYRPGGYDGHEEGVCSERCLQVVAELFRARIACEHCGEATEPTDRLATAAGGVSCSRCRLRLSNALGLEVAAKMQRRGMGVLPGGKAVRS